MTFDQFYVQTYSDRQTLTDYEYALLAWNTAIQEAIDLCAEWGEELDDRAGLGSTETFRNEEQ